jgi:hypothetical protein
MSSWLLVNRSAMAFSEATSSLVSRRRKAKRTHWVAKQRWASGLAAMISLRPRASLNLRVTPSSSTSPVASTGWPFSVLRYLPMPS